MKRSILLVLVVLPLALAAGWVAANGGRPLSADLSGAAEVNAAGEPNQGDLDGSGSAQLTLNQGQGEICYEISVADIDLPAAAAHIHHGAAGTNGPIVVNFDPPGADGTSEGCASADAALIKDIRQNPSEYYVNVHNAAFTGGAVRGQLSK